MDAQHLIPASHLCTHYKVELSFLQTLQDYGLLHVFIQNETLFIEADAIPDVEKIVHLHQDLDINFEGIDAILQLLKRLEKMDGELTILRNRLRLYEG